MKGLTEAVPKCLLELGGRTLLHWQTEALKAAGLSRVIIVTGYRGELLRDFRPGPGEPGFECLENSRWAETNMVRTLMCALPALEGAAALVSYADIVYRPEHVKALLAAEEDIAVTYDRDWRALWSLRNENPLNDAETFRAENGRLADIGGRPESLDQVQGQYMGLLRFSPAGQEIVADHVRSLSPEKADKLDMTGLLRALLARGVNIGAVPVSGGWCECDTESDIILYEEKLAAGAWSHDWR
jgi:choline kinase